MTVRKKTILLIDDDDDFLQVLRERCERIGLEVEPAHNLLSAAMIAAKRKPDIICVDVQMPTGNGLAFCEDLAGDPELSKIPIVVLTGKAHSETWKACERLHAFYLEKGADFWPVLESIIRKVTAETEMTSRDLPKTMLVANAGDTCARKVVIADDDVDMLQLLSKRFSSLGYSAMGVDNALDAINVIHRFMPDLVCLDVGMPSGSGLTVCEMMASDEQLRKIPVIVLTGRSDNETIRRCHDLLVYYVQKSADTWTRVEPLALELMGSRTVPAAMLPSDAGVRTKTRSAPVEAEPKGFELMDAVFAALGASEDADGARTKADKPQSEPAAAENVPWVLCIDDDAEFSEALKIRLEDHGVAVVRAFSGMEGYRLAFTSPARAILLDYHMPNGQGDYILSRLKGNPVTKDIPVIVITGTRDRMLQRRMMAMGASDFLDKPVDFEKLKDRLASYIDILTVGAERELAHAGDR
jgi:CheY-like chemotaxis protein